MKQEKNPIVSICAIIGGMSLAIVGAVLIFAPTAAGEIIPVIWALVVLGIVACYYHYKSSTKPKSK